MKTIQIRGARTHNLKNINLNIPRDRLVVITGLSGSGKSSLAFDTLYAEGQRRYVESLSSYARQFLSMMEKPDVDYIEGLSPAISIEQKSTSHNPRSTVGTITEIHDYLRLLFARVGEPRCPTHGLPLAGRTVSRMVDEVLRFPLETKMMLLAPVVRARKGEHLHVLEDLRRNGFIRARVDGIVIDLDQVPSLDKRRKHSIDVVVDRFKVRKNISSRLAESFETALRLTDGIASVAPMEKNGEEMLFSARYACPKCGYSIGELEPKIFSFNNPAGACPDCDGLGIDQYFDVDRIVDQSASLPEGAILGWDRNNTYYFQMLESLARHYHFDIERPFKKLRTKYKDMILYGNEGEVIEFRYVSDNGTVYRRRQSFEGVIPNMERRHRDTNSERLREELSKYVSTQPCTGCDGTRLRKESRHVFLTDTDLPTITALPVEKAIRFFHNLKLDKHRNKIADRILKEICNRLQFLADVGLNYLSLSRSAETLSGGEAQRIRLASQIGAGLVGVMYILDEPSIGLHQRDNAKLLDTLFRLRDLGNTVLVVEHDEEAIRSADHVVDMGPGAGSHGGQVVVHGTPADISRHPNSITGSYLSGQETIPLPAKCTPVDENCMLSLRGASGNNLQNIDLDLPLGLFTCVTGVSGSGKSTLVNHTLYPVLAAKLNQASRIQPLPYTECEGLEHLDKCIDIDQSPIGRTPRSNPATYTGLFTPVRELFAGTPEARARGYLPGRFSFNVRGGRCEACQGDGLIRVEMHFLPDIYVPCDECGGKRYSRETLEVTYKNRNIHEILQMSVEEAREFFAPVPVIARKLQTLIDVGLSYISLGQSSTTLSGGEAQRIKLSRELSKRDTGRTLYILDEPTTGLHFQDIRQLLQVLHRLRDHGNTVVVIEHNMDVIKTADWIIDLGPEGGSGGGRMVAVGTPGEIARKRRSYTGQFLKAILAKAKGKSKARRKKKQ